eukprot:TRINITY_DN64300_c0_g1_i1.p1 TRINITY_DN64300_c0_g1~~TRINITY_DN64300_c0_g1_i1.p1  ORF type:complete len:463 (+),score=103.45 TRINITY_DN64300_c0_g1_i1:74-1390(+)
MAELGLQRLCTLRGHEDRVWSVAWRPGSDPPQLASCGADRQIRIWSPRGEGAALDAAEGWRLVGVVDASERHSRTLRSLAWSPTRGDILAVASFDASVSLWREAPGEDDADGEIEGGGLHFECAGVVTGHENEVKSVAFSASGDYMATCSRDKSVWIYETEKNFEYECVALLQSHTQDVKMVRWHPTQDVLFSVSYDDTVKIWGPDGDDWSCKETLTAHESTVWCLSFDALGSRFVTCSDDRQIRLWAPGSEPSVPTPEAPAAPASAQAPVGPGVGAKLHQAHFLMPLFRGSSLGLGKAPAAPAPAPAKVPAALERPRKDPSDAACSWCSPVTVGAAQPRPVYSVDWLPFEAAAAPGASAVSTVASACGDDFVRVFQPRDESTLAEWLCVAEVEAHKGDVNSVAWCPVRPSQHGGRAAAVLASAGDDGEVVLWRFGSA